MLLNELLRNNRIKVLDTDQSVHASIMVKSKCQRNAKRLEGLKKVVELGRKVGLLVELPLELRIKILERFYIGK